MTCVWGQSVDIFHVLCRTFEPQITLDKRSVDKQKQNNNLPYIMTLHIKLEDAKLPIKALHLGCMVPSVGLMAAFDEISTMLHRPPGGALNIRCTFHSNPICPTVMSLTANGATKGMAQYYSRRIVESAKFPKFCCWEESTKYKINHVNYPVKKEEPGLASLSPVSTWNTVVESDYCIFPVSAFSHYSSTLFQYVCMLMGYLEKRN